MRRLRESICCFFLFAFSWKSLKPTNSWSEQLRSQRLTWSKPRLTQVHVKKLREARLSPSPVAKLLMTLWLPGNDAIGPSWEWQRLLFWDKYATLEHWIMQMILSLGVKNPGSLLRRWRWRSGGMHEQACCVLVSRIRWLSCGSS